MLIWRFSKAVRMPLPRVGRGAHATAGGHRVAGPAGAWMNHSHESSVTVVVLVAVHMHGVRNLGTCGAGYAPARRTPHKTIASSSDTGSRRPNAHPHPYPHQPQARYQLRRRCGCLDHPWWSRPGAMAALSHVAASRRTQSIFPARLARRGTWHRLVWQSARARSLLVVAAHQLRLLHRRRCTAWLRQTWARGRGGDTSS